MFIDIMCINYNCPLSIYCARKTSPPNSLYQATEEFQYEITPSGIICNKFIQGRQLPKKKRF